MYSNNIQSRGSESDKMLAYVLLILAKIRLKISPYDEMVFKMLLYSIISKVLPRTWKYTPNIHNVTKQIHKCNLITKVYTLQCNMDVLVFTSGAVYSPRHRE